MLSKNKEILTSNHQMMVIFRLEELISISLPSLLCTKNQLAMSTHPSSVPLLSLLSPHNENTVRKYGCKYLILSLWSSCNSSNLLKLV